MSVLGVERIRLHAHLTDGVRRWTERHGAVQKEF
jgi:hypothetical protein